MPNSTSAAAENRLSGMIFSTGAIGAAACVVLLILQPVVFFRSVLINPRAHIPYDIEGFHLPLISYVAQSLRKGVAPFWDPYTMCGMPIHADVQAQVFYPFTWLAILGASLSHRLTLFYFVEALDPLHMALAGLFAFLLLRRMGLARPTALLGASIYQLGGYFASQAQHLCAICTGAWLPLAVLCVWELRERLRWRWVGVLALSIAMAILSGFVASTAVVGIAMLLFMAGLFALREARWKVVPGVVLGCLLGALIAGVELVPLWTLTQNSIAALRADWFITAGGLPLQSLVSLVWPDCYHIFEFPRLYRKPWNYTFLYIYCGMATAVLLPTALFLRRSRARMFLALTVISAVWMLGESTPVCAWIFPHLPRLIRSALYAEFALMAFCFFAGITAAVALDRLGTRWPSAVLWGIALLTSADLIYTGSERPMNAYPGGYRQEELAGDFQVADKLRSIAERTFPPSRTDYTDTTFSRGIYAPGMLGLPTPDSNNPFLLQRIWHVRELFTTGTPWGRDYAVDHYGSPLLRMINVRTVVGAHMLPEDRVARAGLTHTGTMVGYQIYDVPNPLRRFYMVSKVRRSGGAAESVKMLAEASFDPAAEAVVEGVPANRENLATAEVKVEGYEPNRVQLAVTLDRPGFLATSETMYPGWKATVNGFTKELLMTNGAFRGLALPSGNSKIVMTYRPQFFWLTLIISLTALTGAVLLLFAPSA